MSVNINFVLAFLVLILMLANLKLSPKIFSFVFESDVKCIYFFLLLDDVFEHVHHASSAFQTTNAKLLFPRVVIKYRN